jgi:hypothetical protein
MWPSILNLIQNRKKPKVSISPTFNGGKTGAAQVTSEAHIGQKQTAGGKHLQMFTSHPTWWVISVEWKLGFCTLNDSSRVGLQISA